MPLDFDAPHRESDPWGYESHWYEKRRRALIAAMLPRAGLGQVLEIGCSTGLITEQLAARAEQVLAVDISAKAIALARERLEGFSVELLQADITRRFPERGFDHILLCDVAYYLDELQLHQLAQDIERHLLPGGVLLAHWRHGFAQVATPTANAHELLRKGTGLQRLARYEDEDLLIELLCRDAASVARKDGLL